MEPQRAKGWGSGASNRFRRMVGGGSFRARVVRAATAAIDRRANARSGCQ
jgi:hypothetical protein